ncbi:MAG: hypothetical protein HY561_02355 [Gemmatimonadetes bacterium]|nr:hypothetical protein [Gemmatimonadota bacterium]
MSEAGPARGIVVAHGALAQGLVDAVQQIAGTNEDILTPLSNQGLSPDVLVARIRDRLGPGPTIIFTDLPSGSCGFAARRLTRELPGVAVVCGTNLAVLLEFVFHREEPISELVARLLAKGRASICCAPAELETNAYRSVPGR